MCIYIFYVRVQTIIIYFSTNYCAHIPPRCGYVSSTASLGSVTCTVKVPLIMPYSGGDALQTYQITLKTGMWTVIISFQMFIAAFTIAPY